MEIERVQTYCLGSVQDTRQTKQGSLCMWTCAVLVYIESRACKDQNERLSHRENHCVLESKLGRPVAVCNHIREDLIVRPETSGATNHQAY